ncbi:MAG: hypothetical protein K2X82_06095, partial [Gemmataceae bacterium]|nr:hypothetical protein [Gemmataceae bacterium]
LPHDIPAPAADPADARLDLDAALGGLSERQRAAVVLCHLQGLSRTEAAGRLGCAEGTLSATLAAALKKLRARLAGRDPLAVLAAGLTVPAGLSAATARTAAVYTTSAVRAAGVSPAVAGLTEGVLRMVWVKKLTLAAGLAVAAAGVAVGVGGSGLARQEGDKAPPADTAKAGEKGSGDDEVRRLTEELRKLEADEAANHKRQEELRQARVKAEVRRYEAQQAEVRKLLAGKAAYWQIELVGDGWSTPPPGVGGHAVRIEEFDAAGKPLGGYTVSPDARLLKRVLAGGLADPAGPRRAVLWPQVGQIPATTINAVLQACKEAGLKDVIYVPVGTAYPPLFDEPRLVARLTPAGGNPDSPAVLDLAKFGEGTMAVPSATPEPKKGEGGFVPFFSGRFDDPEKP